MKRNAHDQLGMVVLLRDSGSCKRLGMTDPLEVNNGMEEDHEVSEIFGESDLDPVDKKAVLTQAE